MTKELIQDFEDAMRTMATAWRERGVPLKKMVFEYHKE